MIVKRAWIVGGVVGIVTLVVGGVWLAVWLKRDKDRQDPTLAAGTVVLTVCTLALAVGAGFSAWTGLKAAQSSERAARDVLKALALHYEPTFNAIFGLGPPPWITGTAPQEVEGEPLWLDGCVLDGRGMYDRVAVEWETTTGEPHSQPLEPKPDGRSFGGAFQLAGITGRARWTADEGGSGPGSSDLGTCYVTAADVETGTTWRGRVEGLHAWQVDSGMTRYGGGAHARMYPLL